MREKRENIPNYNKNEEKLFKKTGKKEKIKKCNKSTKKSKKSAKVKKGGNF